MKKKILHMLPTVFLVQQFRYKVFANNLPSLPSADNATNNPIKDNILVQGTINLLYDATSTIMWPIAPAILLFMIAYNLLKKQITAEPSEQKKYDDHIKMIVKIFLIIEFIVIIINAGLHYYGLTLNP